jgi:hypothetical protein
MVLALAGFAMMIQISSCNILVQTVVHDEKRGRTMSLYTMAFIGMAPFGSLLAGWLGRRYGVQNAVMFTGMACILATLAYAWEISHLKHVYRANGSSGQTSMEIFFGAKKLYGSQKGDNSPGRPDLLAGKQGAKYRWVCVTMNAPFAPRDGAGLLSFNGKLWLIGGWNPGDKEHFPRICNNEVWSSADGKEWVLEKPGTFGTPGFDPEHDWEGRHTAGYAVFDGKMWIVGGDANQRHYQNDVWCSKDGRNWIPVTNSVPWGPRVLHHTVVFKGKIWIMGGQTLPQFGPAEEKFYSDIWCSSDGKNWKQVVPEGPFWPQRGMIGNSAVLNGRIWIIGGGTYDTPGHPQRKFFNDVWSSADGARWQCLTEKAPWEPRQYHEVAAFDGKLWVLEGYDGRGNRNDVWYSEDGANWNQLPNTPWKPRHAASVCVHNNALWVIAGNNMESDVWKLEKY